MIQRMKAPQRLLSILLCCALVLGLLPVNALAADGPLVYIMGQRLEEGYYWAFNDHTMSDGTIREGSTIRMDLYSPETPPEGRNNYIHYQAGILTIHGDVDFSSVDAIGNVTSAMYVASGKLTVKGDGDLRLYGVQIPALSVSDSAEIDFDLTPNGSSQQLSISASGSMAVWGDLTISQADRVCITTDDYPYDSDDTSYDTINGSAVIHAESVLIQNETNGACVRGGLRAEATDYLQIINQSKTTAALTGGTYSLKTDDLNMQSYCGPMVNGDITLSPIESGERKGSFHIDGCTTGGVPVVEGNITVTGGSLRLVNQNGWSDTTDERYTQFKDLKADGPLLVGDLTMRDADGLRVVRQDAGTTPLIRGDLSLTDCADDGVSAAARIDRGYGSGAAVDGDITLQNSSLGIGAYCDDNNVLSTEPGILNCALTMKNSVLSVYSFLADWESIAIQDDYLWYVSKYTLSNPTYTKSTDQPLGTKSSTDKAYLEIRSGDHMKTTRAASFSGRITGTALQSVSATAYLNLHGDSYDFRQVPGYQELTMKDEEGEWTAYGIPAGTDLTNYLALETPQGGVHWKLTAAEDAYQDDRGIVVTVSGIAGGTNCSEPVNLTISGRLLSSGEDLAVTPNQDGRWDITGSTTQATEYDLWVYGVQVTSRNQADILSNGMASFDPQTGTLFLKNADLQGEVANPVIRSTLDKLTLSVTGQNTLRSMESAAIDAKRMTVALANADASLTVCSDQKSAFVLNPILPNGAEVWSGDSAGTLSYAAQPNYTASRCIRIALHETEKTWTYDPEHHWRVCAHEGCTQKFAMAPHDIAWVVDKGSSGALNGNWHKECKECSYQGASEEMPIFGPEITTRALLDAELGRTYSASIQASGSKPLSWNVVSGSLPDGLTLDAKTGRITGRPSKEGTFTFTVEVGSGASAMLNAKQTYTIQVTPSASELRFVQRVTQNALKNADADSRENIENAIYNLMFKAQFRPTGISASKDRKFENTENAKFTGSVDVNKNFTIQNYHAITNQNEYKAGIIKDSVLGPMKLQHRCGGCMAYAQFCEQYTYGHTGNGKHTKFNNFSTVRSAEKVKEFIRKWADPGEEIQLNAPHSIVFLGEADNGNGIYCISYGGGRHTTKKPNHTLLLEYRSYDSLKGSINYVDDTNGGSYFAGTAKTWKAVREAQKASKTIIRINCPVEASVILDGFILDSEYGPFARSFGTVERVGDGIVFTLDYSEDYVLDIRGVGEGTMDAEIEYLDEAGNSLGSQKFDSMPITPDTEITSGILMPECAAVLYYVEDSKYVSAWDAYLGETATEANDELLSINMPDNEEDTPSSGHGGGSSGGSSSGNAISVGSMAHGSVTVSPKTASKGDTVTLTVSPDKGCTLETLTVTDESGRKVELTDRGDGTYTFTMPASNVEVEATFKAAKSGNPFVDVPSGAYYEDAVIWAVGKGITTGTDATHFTPGGSCTRAQAVTFLWRAAGSPAPKSTTMPFTDVKAGSYYYDAVLWAVENGITEGTSATEFSPDAVCTRGQIVTFLWRSEKSPAAGTVDPFVDVKPDAYYADAVLWAVKEDVTKGTTATTFSPDANCTRAQIVTFIWRALAE